MKIEEVIIDAFKTKQKIDKLNAKLTKLKSNIQSYFDKTANKVDKIEVNNVTVKKCERINIEYFPDKLREKLDKELFNEVTHRKYFIKDLDRLVELLKRAGVKPKEFKKLIDVEISVDKKAIKQAFEVGDITKKDLEGCYSAKITKYIDLREGGKNC